MARILQPSTGTDTDAPESSEREQTSLAVVEAAAAVAIRTDARAIFVYADALPEGAPPWPDGVAVFHVTRTKDEETAQKELGHRFIAVPDVSLNRFGQIKLAVRFALSKGLVSPQDTVICLTGAASSGYLDTVLALHVADEFGAFPMQASEPADEPIAPEVLERVVRLGAELGAEGREGKPAGALFVMGDTETVLSLSRQLILNPFRGYAESERNILDEGLEETVKELAALDGAFIVRADGVIESAGTYLKPSSQAEFELPAGLGARHRAAAAITSLTRAIAVCVSESTGTVTVFRSGRVMTELEKPRRHARLFAREEESERRDRAPLSTGWPLRGPGWPPGRLFGRRQGG